MPFEPSDVSQGNWLANMRDLASEKEVFRIRKGFVRFDPHNIYKGEPSPRNILTVELTSTGESGDVGVRTGYSRDTTIAEAAEYLENAPAGTYLDLRFTETEGSSYIGIELVGEGVEGE